MAVETFRKKTCFVISPIGKPDSDARKHSDRFLKHVVRKVVESEKYGYSAVRADELSKPGIITNQVVKLLADADLVIADMHGYNPNVFYELAIRHVVRKPAIQFIGVGYDIPFDLGQLRTIHYDLTDPDSLDTARAELERHLDSIQAPDFKVEDPIGLALTLDRMGASGDATQQGMAEILRRLEMLAPVGSLALSAAPPSSDTGTMKGGWARRRLIVEKGDLIRTLLRPYGVEVTVIPLRSGGMRVIFVHPDLPHMEQTIPREILDMEPDQAVTDLIGLTRGSIERQLAEIGKKPS